MQHMTFCSRPAWRPDPPNPVDACLQLVQSVVQSQGFNALPCAKNFVKHTAPFPRTAFTMKNGKVLYNRAIHPGIDVSKVSPGMCFESLGPLVSAQLSSTEVCMKLGWAVLLLLLCSAVKTDRRIEQGKAEQGSKSAALNKYVETL
eukprot:469047-Pelagomonas_calceolata.AAC.4